VSIIEKIKKENHGFFTSDKLHLIIAENRLQPVLVRCGNGRFTCPAQDVEHFVGIIEREGEEYIRDISLYTGGK